MYAAEKNKLPKTYKPLKYDPEQSPNDRKVEYCQFDLVYQFILKKT